MHLRRQIEGCFTHPSGPGVLPKPAQAGPARIRALILPHAGYEYSGPVAAHGILRLAEDQVPSTLIILGPNHFGLGPALAVPQHLAWQTPLGTVPVHQELAKALLAAFSLLEKDNLAHSREHSIEVQLPFLQHVFGNAFAVLPISMRDQDFKTSQRLGEALAFILAEHRALLIASTDFTHYETVHTAREKDRHALDAIQALDATALAQDIERYNISMCGPGPVMAVLMACRLLGPFQVSLLHYGNSGDTSGDYSRVVAYASLEIRAS